MAPHAVTIQRLSVGRRGVTWNRSYGKTADLAEDEGQKTNEARFVAGIRMWF